jgi:hypothetical protein
MARYGNERVLLGLRNLNNTVFVLDILFSLDYSMFALNLR